MKGHLSTNAGDSTSDKSAVRAENTGPNLRNEPANKAAKYTCKGINDEYAAQGIPFHYSDPTQGKTCDSDHFNDPYAYSV